MDAADEARRLEEELEDYPDDRDEVLLEAAKAWQRAGNHTRAIALLTEAAELGEDTGFARVSLAESLFAVDRADEARAQLDALRKSWPDSPEVLHDAALLMEKRGAPEEALTWYDLGVARLDSDERTDSYLTVGRRRVRRALGLPEDDLDASVEHLERHMDDVVRKARAKMDSPPDPAG
jgi:tetratricopeptide (TPR) repeat protein